MRNFQTKLTKKASQKKLDSVTNSDIDDDFDESFEGKRGKGQIRLARIQDLSVIVPELRTLMNQLEKS